MYAKITFSRPENKVLCRGIYSTCSQGRQSRDRGAATAVAGRSSSEETNQTNFIYILETVYLSINTLSFETQ